MISRMLKDQKSIPLLQHALDAPSAFTPENLLEAVRTERDLPRDPVPEVCVLEFDGDLTDWLVGAASPRGGTRGPASILPWRQWQWTANASG